MADYSFNSTQDDESQLAEYSSKRLYRISKYFFKDNRLYDSVNVLKHVIGRGYKTDKSRFLLARCYDKISFLSNDFEYEDLARETYEELLVEIKGRFKRRRIKKKYNKFINRMPSSI